MRVFESGVGHADRERVELGDRAVVGRRAAAGRRAARSARPGRRRGRSGRSLDRAHARLVQVDAGDVEAGLGERHRQRQAGVAEADDADLRLARARCARRRSRCGCHKLCSQASDRTRRGSSIPSAIQNLPCPFRTPSARSWRTSSALWGFLVAAAIVLVLTPLVAALAPRIGGVDDKTDRPRVHKRPVPAHRRARDRRRDPRADVDLHRPRRRLARDPASGRCWRPRSGWSTTSGASGRA